MPARWCTEDDVQKKLTFLSGSDIDSTKIEPRIDQARDDIIQKFGGKFSADVLATWTNEKTVPPQIRWATTYLAAAYVLHECTDNESYSDRSSKAYGYKREAEDMISLIREDKIVLVTSQSDSTAVSGNVTVISSSTYGTTKAFNTDKMDRFSGEAS